MATAPDPSVQRRRLRTELRKARDAAGMKQADVAKAMDWSPSKLIRIESGHVSISTNDLRALLDYYKVKDRGRVATLLELAKSSRAGSFYDQYAGHLKAGFREYLAYEASASVIRQWEPILVSGLLQTEEYARAILQHTYGVDERDSERLWAVRQHRQELHDREDPPEMRFLIDESAVRRHVGRDGKTMLRQIERLLEFGALDHVTIQVLPFSAGANQGMAGSFILLEFSDPDLDDLVHLESIDEVTIRDDSELIARYLDRFQALEEQALSPEDTVAFLEKLVGEHRAADPSHRPASAAG
jgi:transcriptional regulator with XRE-family HTH domain